MSNVSKSQYRSSCSVSVVLCLFLTACLFTIGASAAENAAWFPYVNTHYGSVPSYAGGSPFGGPGWHLLKKFNSTTPNPLWNEDSLFYNDSNTESWFTQGGATKTWQIAVHNTNPSVDFSYSGGVDRRLRVYVYSRLGGNPVGTSEVWSDSTALIKTSGGSDMVWNNANKCFYVTVPRNATVMLNCAGNPNGLFNVPTGDGIYKATIKIAQPQGYDFLATMRGQDTFQWRTDTGTTESSFSDEKVMSGTFGYPSVYENVYNTVGSNTVRLPFYREDYMPATSTTSANRTKPDWATVCYVVNTTNSADTLTFRVYALDGTLIGQQKTKTLAAHQRWEFCPSQFFPSNNYGAYGRGYVEVTGTRPAAVAIQLRFPKSTSFIGRVKNGTWVSDYTRINSSQAMTFFVN